MAESSSSLATKLLNIKDYSDLTLECDEQEFRVHRATVCAQSPVIAAALRGDFMVCCTSGRYLPRLSYIHQQLGSQNGRATYVFRH